MGRCTIAVVFIALVATSCGQGDRPSTTGEARITDELRMSDYRFTPAEVFGVTSHQLTFRLANKGKVKHNFSVEATPIDVDLKPGQTKTVIFVTPGSVGPVRFFCKIHDARGMHGVIQVLTAPGVTRSP
jgi:plastocyanin